MSPVENQAGPSTPRREPLIVSSQQTAQVEDQAGPSVPRRGPLIVSSQQPAQVDSHHLQPSYSQQSMGQMPAQVDSHHLQSSCFQQSMGQPLHQHQYLVNTMPYQASYPALFDWGQPRAPQRHRRQIPPVNHQSSNGHLPRTPPRTPHRQNYWQRTRGQAKSPASPTKSVPGIYYHDPIRDNIHRVFVRARDSAKEFSDMNPGSPTRRLTNYNAKDHMIIGLMRLLAGLNNGRSSGVLLRALVEIEVSPWRDADECIMEAERLGSVWKQNTKQEAVRPETTQEAHLRWKAENQPIVQKSDCFWLEVINEDREFFAEHFGRSRTIQYAAEDADPDTTPREERWLQNVNICSIVTMIKISDRLARIYRSISAKKQLAALEAGALLLTPDQRCALYDKLVADIRAWDEYNRIYHPTSHDQLLAQEADQVVSGKGKGKEVAVDEMQYAENIEAAYRQMSQEEYVEVNEKKQGMRRRYTL